LISREWKRHKFALLMTRVVGATSAMAIYGIFMPPTLQAFVAAIGSVAIGVGAYSFVSTIYEFQQKHLEIRTNIQEKLQRLQKGHCTTPNSTRHHY
jgi:hypothetical protein